MVFIEDYDMSVARYLVQGADIWLNTPLRPREASGTSGMKATANGVINMSTLDGWWDEAYDVPNSVWPETGWAIGRGELYEDLNYQNDIESRAIYGILEKEIVPLFYNRNSNGLPHKWIAQMKAAMRAICPVFNTNRMLREYTERFYLPAAQRYRHLTEGEMTDEALLDGTYTVLIESRRTYGSIRKAGDATFDFVVDNDGVAPLPLSPRQFVTQEACNACHLDLQMHGGARFSVTGCAICHTVGAEDDSDVAPHPTVEFGVMIHKIHTGEDLQEVKAGGTYKIWGHNESEHDYSTVVYPQDSRNCTKCHDGTDADTPDGDNWKDESSTSACTSCHTADAVSDDYPAFPALTAAEITTAHVIPAQVAAASMELNILDVSTAAGTGGALDVTIQFSVTDPTNVDLEYDITDTTTVDLTPLSFLIGWDTTDYSNMNSGSTPAQALRVGISSATDTGNQIYTLTVTDAVPAGVTGSGVVGFQGHPYTDQDGDGDVDDRVPVTSVVKSFAITDATAVDRRTVVDIDKCNNCHGSLSLHGSNRTDEIQICVICHNADATDISVRPADATTAADGKAEETIDFKYMIHAIHAGDKSQHGFRENGIVVYGYRGSVHDYSHVRFPGNLKYCEACHNSGTYELPVGTGVLPTTVGTDSNLTDPDDDKNITPTIAACSSCHDDILAKNHMAENGGSFDFILFKTEAETNTAGPSGTQPAGHSNRTDCSACHS